MQLSILVIDRSEAAESSGKKRGVWGVGRTEGCPGGVKGGLWSNGEGAPRKPVLSLVWIGGPSSRHSGYRHPRETLPTREGVLSLSAFKSGRSYAHPLL